MRPPYKVTSSILKLISSISEKLGAVNAVHIDRPPTELRKENRIKSIQASLAIEGNTLSEDQITSLLNNKRVLAPQKDILEVQNAIVVYDKLQQFKPYQKSDFLKAHRLLMKQLISDAGKYRTKGVGILKGSKVAHVAPPGNLVNSLMNSLFDYLKSDEISLIKSCVFHYELEFIHPFMDGNGRMGRLWQTLILMQQYPVFEFLPVESIIKKKQLAYYTALAKADKAGQATPFIEFMLQIIETALTLLLNQQTPPLTQENRIQLFAEFIGTASFSRQDYLRHIKSISTATASRDLKQAVKQNLLKKEGDRRLARYRFSRSSS